MVIYWKPVSAGSTSVNLIQQGFGELYDTTSQTIKKGRFAEGKLSDPNSTVVYYSGECNIFYGQVTDDELDGQIVHYTISADDWKTFQPPVTTFPAEKKIETHSNGVITVLSTSSVQLKISAQMLTGAVFCECFKSFLFEEV